MGTGVGGLGLYGFRVFFGALDGLASIFGEGADSGSGTLGVLEIKGESLIFRLEHGVPGGEFSVFDR